MLLPTENQSKYRTKGEIAYESLREGIVSGSLKPGQRLPLNRIAEELGISEIPVREAVKRLEAKGLIVQESGAFLVAKLSPEDLEEDYVIRSALEVLAIRTAVPRVTPAILGQLSALVDQMQVCVDQGRHQEYGALNDQFHALLYAQNPYPKLQQLLADFWGKAQRTRILFLLFKEKAAISNLEHKALLECLARQDVDGAEQLIRTHTFRTLQTLKALLEKAALGEGSL